MDVSVFGGLLWDIPELADAKHPGVVLLNDLSRVDALTLLPPGGDLFAADFRLVGRIGALLQPPLNAGSRL
jgi:hypothetical protein